MNISVFSATRLRILANHPHLIGHMVGKKDLTELHSKWIRELWLPKRHTALQAHRGAYKTTACTEIGIIWWLLFHPNDRIGLVRETWTEANNTMKTIATYMEAELIAELFKAIHDRYPKATVQRDGRLVYSFKGSITKEGSLDAFGVDTVPTGTHYDRILCDDVVTIRDRYSRAKRERTKENLQEIKNNILDPGKYMNVVGTPWHKEDAWSAKGIPVPEKYTVYDTNIMSPEVIAEKKENMNGVMWAANYELKHVSSDDALFKDPVFDVWDSRMIKRARGHVDARFKGKHFTAVTIIGQRTDGNYMVWVKVYDADVRSVSREIHKEFTKRNVSVLHIETNPDKGYTADLFRRPVDGNYIHVEDYHESTNKDNKIVSYVTEFWKKLIFAEDCDDIAITQICEYRPGEEPNDAPDSLAALLREMAYPIDKETAPGQSGLYQR